MHIDDTSRGSYTPSNSDNLEIPTGIWFSRRGNWPVCARGLQFSQSSPGCAGLASRLLQSMMHHEATRGESPARQERIDLNNIPADSQADACGSVHEGSHLLCGGSSTTQRLNRSAVADGEAILVLQGTDGIASVRVPEEMVAPVNGLVEEVARHYDLDIPEIMLDGGTVPVEEAWGGGD